MNAQAPALRARGSVLLIAIILLLVIAGAALAASERLISQAESRARRASIAALAAARTALLGYATHYPEEHAEQGAGYLPCPDNSNSGSPPGISCHARDHGALGRLPYRRLGLPPLRDGREQCLWYAVAGSFKHNPKPLTLNWDSPGQFEIVDSGGHVIGGAGYSAIAVVIAPGLALPGQNRPPAAASTGSQRCPGSTLPAADLAAFLDRPYPVDISGEVQFISGQAGSEVNDIVIWLTTDDIFGALRRRPDFAPMIDDVLDIAASGLSAQLDTPAFFAAHTDFTHANRAHGRLPAASELGIAPEAVERYDNWRDQLRFVACTDASSCLSATLADSAQTPSPATTEDCRALVIFGGERQRGAAPQRRRSASERADPAQYLEGENLASFTSGSGAYAGWRHFAVVTPDRAASEDLIRCLP
ncbi:hypothetical protein AGMMS50225_12460 [Betaproteobacteria bacterium]|nr:hypothetical protein AGMMS50225_12460 [Betaproteobacteria bacterium]